MNFDLFQLINNLADHYAWLDAVMRFFAQDIVYIMIAVLAILWLSNRQANQLIVFYSCLSAVLALVVAGLGISPAVAHPRPFVGHHVHQLIAHAADPSFPSDHATLAFSLAFSIYFASRRFGAILLFLAVLTGFARVYVGVHYPADILGGAVLGFLSSLAVVKMRNRIDPIPLWIIRFYKKATARIPFLSR